MAAKHDSRRGADSDVDRPLISIVICCYNRARLLPETLETVFAQTYAPAEVLVLDDGSTDGTGELMRGYGDRVRYHHQPNRGIAIARSNAGRLARGELIAFQDDDDFMPPDRLEVLHRALSEADGCAFAVGDLSVIGPEDRAEQVLGNHPAATSVVPVVYPNGVDAVLWPRVPATNHTTLFRRADAQRIGWFDPRYRIGGEDKDFFARLGRLGGAVHVPRVVSYYRRGHVSLTAQNHTTSYASLRLFQNHLEQLPSDDPLKRRLEQRILMTLERMQRMQRRGVPLPAEIPPGYAAEALRYLGIGDRSRYRAYVAAKALVAALEKGVPGIGRRARPC